MFVLIHVHASLIDKTKLILDQLVSSTFMVLSFYYIHTYTNTYTHTINGFIFFSVHKFFFFSFATQRILPHFFFTWYFRTRAWLNFFFFQAAKNMTTTTTMTTTKQCISIINVAMFNVFFFFSFSDFCFFCPHITKTIQIKNRTSFIVWNTPSVTINRTKRRL
jgi:hypothetical protein